MNKISFCPIKYVLSGPAGVHMSHFQEPYLPPPSCPYSPFLLMSGSSVQVLRQGFSSHMEEQGEQEGQEENLVIKEEPEEQPEDLSIVHPNDVKILEQQN